MRSGRLFIKYWLPVVVWFFFIFSASTSVGSAEHTSRFIGPLLRWLFPGITNETLALVHVAVRKCAHVTEYAVLALLLRRALQHTTREDTRPWHRPAAVRALWLCVIAATADEYFQSFWDTRLSSPWDVMIDSVGASLGLGFVWVIGRFRKKW